MNLETRIRVILLMGQFQSPTLVIRALRREGLPEIPTVSAIINLYDKFCSFGTVLDLPREGRPKISDQESTELIKGILGDRQIGFNADQCSNKFEPFNNSASN